MKMPKLTNLKGETYKFILVIIDLFIKMVYYNQMMDTIDVLRHAKIIIDEMLQITV